MGTIARKNCCETHWQRIYKQNYISYLREKCKKKLDRKIEKGYNIYVSPYAIDTYQKQKYDEVYTECRVYEILTNKWGVMYVKIAYRRRKKTSWYFQTVY